MERKKLRIDGVMLIYGGTLCCMLFFLLTLNKALNYVHYLYALLLLLVVLINQKIVLNKAIVTVVGCFVLHALLFGYLIVPASVAARVRDNAKETLVLWCFVFATAHYVFTKKIFREFLLISQFCMAAFMDFCYFTHFNGIAPIKFFPALFGIGQRVRFDFGLPSYNQAAYMAACSVILSWIVLKERLNLPIKFGNFDLYRLFVWGSMACSALVLLSTQTRGALMEVVLFLMLSAFQDNQKVRRKMKEMTSTGVFVTCTAGLLFVFLGYGSYVFGSSAARAGYLGQCWNIYRRYASRWFGMGFAPFSAFLTNGFGLNTPPLDCYYLYIVCTTGIVGACIIFVGMMYMLYQYVAGFSLRKMTGLTRYFFPLLLCNLIVAFSEASFVAPLSPYSYIYWVGFLVTLSEMRHANKKKIKLKTGRATTSNGQ